MNKWYRTFLISLARRYDRKAARLRARVKALTPKRKPRMLKPVEDVSRAA